MNKKIIKDKDINSTSVLVAEGKIEIIDSPEEVKKIKIDPFSDNLGREDLNQLANKVNEIIQFINGKN